MTLPSKLKQEIASVERDINYVVYGGTLENPDETLLKRGGGKGLKLYDEIEEDSHAYAVLQKRKLAVIARPWEVKAASDRRLDKKAADLVRAQVETKLDHLTMELLDGTLKGFSVSELMWQDSGSEIFVDEFKARDQRRFTFTPKNELRLLTRQNMVSGEAVPERKFIRHSFGAKDGNPFGRGLGSKLYFPVWFKRQGISFWLVFCEKFGMPTAVGKYGQNATEADQKKLLNALRALAQDAGVIVPENMAIEFLEATRSSTSDLYERLIRYMDEQVSEAVLGETLTTNIGSVGSKAAADTHDGVRLEVSKADSDLLSQTLNNTLCKWIVELNMPGANPPTIWRVFEEEEDLNSRSQRDKTLFDIGFKLKLEAVKEIYGDYYEVVDQGGAGDGQVSNEDFLKNSGVDAATQQDTQQQTPQDNNSPGFAEDEEFLRSSGFVFLSEEIPGFAELLAVFSESNKVAIKDANSLLELRAIIETVYQDGISAIPEAYLDGDNFVGIFEDRVSEQLVKRFNFTLSESGIDYKLINPGDVSNFGEVEFANAPVKKKKNCVKGVSCGIGCISPAKACRKGGDAIPGDRVAALKQSVGGGSGAVEQPKPEVKKVAPEPVKETPKPMEQPKPEVKKVAAEPVKEMPKPKNIPGFEFNDSVISTEDNPRGVSEDGHLAKFIDQKTGASIEARVGDKYLTNRPNDDGILDLSNTPQAWVMGKENDYGNHKFRAAEEVARSLPNSNDFVGLRLNKVNKENMDLVPELLSGVASRYKEGALIAITAEDKTSNQNLKKLGLTGYPPGKKPAIFVGVVNNGKVVPVDPDKLKKQVDTSKDVRLLRDAQFEVGIYQKNAKNEELIVESLRAKEDVWVGRNPQPGKVKDLNHYEKESEKWAKSLGLEDAANGFSQEATKAHDVAHPITHEMLNMSSEQINEFLGGFKNKDGSINLAAEEAIVNIVEHLSRGDSFEASLINGKRLVRVLSRRSTKKKRDYLRSPEFDKKLEELAAKIYKNDNFHDYMKVVRYHNQISGTVTEKGNIFNSTVI
jgi:hypothetical protein